MEKSQNEKEWNDLKETGKCYKLEVIEYYFDSSKTNLFVITFKVVEMMDTCNKISENATNSTNDSQNDNTSPQKINSNIEITLAIPRKNNDTYTGTIDTDEKYVITAKNIDKNITEPMSLEITDQTDGLLNYFNGIKTKYRSQLYNVDRFRRRTSDGKNNIPQYEGLLKNFNAISKNYYVIGNFKSINDKITLFPGNIKRIDEKGGAPSRKSRRARKAHKSKKSRKSRRNSRR